MPVQRALGNGLAMQTVMFVQEPQWVHTPASAYGVMPGHGLDDNNVVMTRLSQDSKKDT